MHNNFIFCILKKKLWYFCWYFIIYSNLYMLSVYYIYDPHLFVYTLLKFSSSDFEEQTVKYYRFYLCSLPYAFCPSSGFNQREMCVVASSRHSHQTFVLYSCHSLKDENTTIVKRSGRWTETCIVLTLPMQTILILFD